MGSTGRLTVFGTRRTHLQIISHANDVVAYPCQLIHGVLLGDGLPVDQISLDHWMDDESMCLTYSSHLWHPSFGVALPRPLSYPVSPSP